MGTAVWWKWVLCDSKDLPRKFCGHSGSGRRGRDVRQRMEPPGCVGWRREGPRRPAEVRFRLRVREPGSSRPADTGGRTAAPVEGSAEEKPGEGQVQSVVGVRGP